MILIHESLPTNRTEKFEILLVMVKVQFVIVKC